MARPKLRLYFGPEPQDDAPVEEASAAPSQLTVRLAEILPLLAEAYRGRRLWLNDFADDQITISSDLYEILLAYENLHRPAA
ncbi:MAG: hypothetical protein RIC55_33020 [Pirellulaceae bacterium]